MALRVARGLFRLWLVLSVLWIGGVGVVTWRHFPVDLFTDGRPSTVWYIRPGCIFGAMKPQTLIPQPIQAGTFD